MILRDIKIVVGLDMKLMLKNKAVLVILAVISAIFLLLLRSFSAEISEKSNIPIGIADEDRTELSRTFLENCRKQEGIYVYAGKREHLEQKLYKNEITGYFVIKQGFQENVKKGSSKNLIESYAYESASFSGIVSDILAGEIMNELCLANTWNMYAGLEHTQSKFNREQFYDYIRKLKEDFTYQYSFDIQFVDANQAEQGKTAFRYQLIYEQIELGIISMLFSIIAMFLVWSIMENPKAQIQKRNGLLSIPVSAFAISDIVAAGVVMTIYTICGSSVMYLMTHSFHSMAFLRVIAAGAAFSFGTVMVFWCIRKAVKSNTAYQLISFFLIVLMGAVSMLGMFNLEMENIAGFIPNQWFIKGITDVIV